MYKVNMFMNEDNMCIKKDKMYIDKIDLSMKSGNKYATAYIIPQKYENLFSVNEAFKKGTIFKDLDIPYDKNKKCNYW